VHNYEREGHPELPKTFREYRDLSRDSVDIDALAHYYRHAYATAALLIEGIKSELSFEELAKHQDLIAETEEMFSICNDVFDYTLEQLKTCSS